ncbi:hypothetical protein [Kribbella speibonae]|uniref:Uncharacterized protein n=1 Tax=Kribbella speibonae TaxID=1572660 RepID=A0A4R0INC5_9ACTN|nr:hypothetical protein [Kribbella speibonae]TCC15549.1 hypothetical protein E0H58_42345 [Kribbella speibonae]TCC33930.1 hypothetical protein E0H92_28165 [Kribbella speibonae]
MTEHPGEQFPPDVDPDVEPGFDPYQGEEKQTHPDYDTEPGAQDTAQESVEHLDPAAVEFGPEFARAPGQEHEHAFVAESAEDPAHEDEGGHPLVEETMARLDELRDKPVSEHGEVYADLHERLQTALVEADAEQGDRS